MIDPILRTCKSWMPHLPIFKYNIYTASFDQRSDNNSQWITKTHSICSKQYQSKLSKIIIKFGKGVKHH